MSSSNSMVKGIHAAQVYIENQKEKQHSEMQKHILGEQPLNDERIIIFIF